MTEAPGADGFFNLYNHDLVRVAVATPAVRVADPAYNHGVIGGLRATAR